MKRKLLIGAGIAFIGLALFIFAVAISSWMVKVRVPVTPLALLNVSGGKHYAAATGTMVTEGERSAMPLQVSEIKCFAHSRECVVGTAMIAYGDKLYVAVDASPVIEWTDSHVVFGEIGDCVTNTYTLNWVTKSVTGIRVKNSNPPKGRDCSMIKVDQLRSTLREGLDVGREEEERAQPAFIKMLSAIFSMLR
jgi:hypothetical protein